MRRTLMGYTTWATTSMNGAPTGTTMATTRARPNEIREGRRAARARLRGAARGGIILRSRARRRVPAFRRSSNTPTMDSESDGLGVHENSGAIRLLHVKNRVPIFCVCYGAAGTKLAFMLGSMNAALLIGSAPYCT